MFVTGDFLRNRSLNISLQSITEVIDAIPHFPIQVKRELEQVRSASYIMVQSISFQDNMNRMPKGGII